MDNQLMNIRDFCDSYKNVFNTTIGERLITFTKCDFRLTSSSISLPDRVKNLLDDRDRLSLENFKKIVPEEHIYHSFHPFSNERAPCTHREQDTYRLYVCLHNVIVHGCEFEESFDKIPFVFDHLLEKSVSMLSCKNSLFHKLRWDFIESPNEYGSPINFASLEMQEKGEPRVSFVDGKIYKRIMKEDKDMVASKRRRSVRIGKFLRIMFPDADDSEIEQAVNEWKASFDTSTRFEIVSGEKILDYYHHSMHSQRSIQLGSLENSCMRHDFCRKYLKFYAIHDFIRMLAALDGDGKVAGRAILWDLPNGNTFMDRVYGGDAIIVKFQNYAKEQKWWIKAQNNYCSKELFLTPDDNYTKVKYVDDITFNVDIDNFDWVPYMDTFKAICPKTGTISNGAGKWLMVTTDGCVFDQEADEYINVIDVLEEVREEEEDKQNLDETTEGVESAVSVTISRNNDNVMSLIQNVQHISRRYLPEMNALGQWWEMTYNNNENE